MRAATSGRVPVLAVALLAAGLLQLWASGPQAGPPSAMPVWAQLAPGTSARSVSLFDDDTGLSLFDGATLLVPGRSQVNCINVGTVGAAAGDAVTLTATSLAGTALADHLTIAVDVGTGGRFGDCAGFGGSRVWTGSLTALAATGGTDGVATGWQPAATETRSFRISVSVDSAAAAQGLSASADLQWRLIPGSTPPSTTPSPTTPATTAPATTTPATSLTSGPVTSPAPHATSATSPGTTSPAPASASGPPDSSSGSGSVAGAGPGPGTGPGGRPDVVLTRTALGALVQAVRTAIRQGTLLTSAVASRPQLPLGLLLLVALFLMVQDRIDARDPKLAHAATTQRDAELTFPDLFGGRR